MKKYFTFSSNPGGGAACLGGSMANKVSILYRKWIVGVLLVLGCSCQRLDEQPTPIPQTLPSQVAETLPVGPDGTVYVDLLSAQSLAGGAVEVRIITPPDHGTLTPDFEHNRLIYRTDATFDGADTAAYSLSREGVEPVVKNLYFTGESRVCHIKANDDDTTVLYRPTALVEFNVLANDEICSAVTIDPIPEYDSTGQLNFFRMGRKPGTIAWLGSGAVPKDYVLWYTIRKPGSDQVERAKFTVHAIDPCQYDPNPDVIRDHEGTPGYYSGFNIPISRLLENDGCPQSYDRASVTQTGGSNVNVSYDAVSQMFTVSYSTFGPESEYYFYYKIERPNHRDPRTVKVTITK